jgi:hypothetical protein
VALFSGEDRKALKAKGSACPDHRVLKIFRKIWKSGQVDCDWFSNDELPPLPNLPDRHASSGGCLRDGRGFGAVEARGTAWQRKRRGADPFPIFGPLDGGNGCGGDSWDGGRRSGDLHRAWARPASSVQGSVARERRRTAGGPERASDPTLSRLSVDVVFQRAGAGGLRRAATGTPDLHTHTRTAGSSRDRDGRSGGIGGRPGLLLFPVAGGAVFRYQAGAGPVHPRPLRRFPRGPWTFSSRSNGGLRSAIRA